jgi:hypothetical protein
LTNEKNKSLSLLLQRCSRRIVLWYYLHCNDVAAFNLSTTNATIVGGRIHPNRFGLMEVSTPFPTPIATCHTSCSFNEFTKSSIVDRNFFFRQGGDQLNGGRGTFDCQPVTMTPSFCTIVVHRRLGTDQCDGGTKACKHSILSTLALPRWYIGRRRQDHTQTHQNHHTVPQGHLPS